MGMIFDNCIWVGLSSNQLDAQVVIDTAGDLPVFTSASSFGELSFGVNSRTDATVQLLRAA
jgi:hypothetical protein